MAEIADRLNISRQSVGRHLQRAKEKGIVRITIHSPGSRCTDLETSLEEAFGLKEAIVVTPISDSESSIKEALGEAAAELIERSVISGDVIGVSWSTSVLACAEKLHDTNRENISVVQMNGSQNRGSNSTRADYIIEKIANAFNAERTILPAPMIVDYPEIIESLLKDSQFSLTLEQARNATVAIFGVGDISKYSSLYKTGYIDDALLSLLKKAGAVGDVCGHFYNEHGEICLPELDKRTIAINLPDLQGKRISTAIAGTTRKTPAILGMLRGQYCNTLVTDEDTAKSLLKEK